MVGSTNFGVSTCFKNGRDVVRAVRKRSVADKAGIKRGDTVKSVHGIEINSPERVLEEIHNTLAKRSGKVEMKVMKRKGPTKIVSLYSGITKIPAKFNLNYYGLSTWRDSRLRLRDTTTKVAVVVGEVTVTPQNSNSNTLDWRTAARVNTAKAFGGIISGFDPYCGAKVEVAKGKKAPYELRVQVTRSSQLSRKKWFHEDVYLFQLVESGSGTVLVSERVSSGE